MKLPELKIGSFIAKIPIIQGGMSIRVSTSALAIPVAECGGIGTIGGSGIPVPELQEDIRKGQRVLIKSEDILPARRHDVEPFFGFIDYFGFCAGRQVDQRKTTAENEFFAELFFDLLGIRVFKSEI